MRNIIFLSASIVFFIFAMAGLAKANDTILRKAVGNEYFYNFTHNPNFDIYVGSSSGAYRLDEYDLKKINNRLGYIFFDGSEIATATSSNADRDFRFRHLLPGSYSVYPQQSIIKNNLIYIICNGTLFIYEVIDVKFLMKGKSIRCFTENSIGTYDGIYCFGKRLTLPDYTTGYILEHDSTFYICYDGLAVYRPDSVVQFLNRPTTHETLLGDTPAGYSRDIVKVKDGGFIISTTKGLYLLDKKLRIAKTIYETDDKTSPVIIDLFEVPYTRVLTFAASKTLYRYDIDHEETLEILVLNEPVIAGYRQNKRSELEYILVSENSLTHFNYADNKQKQIPGLYQAHSAIPLGSDSVVISSQNGIYLAFLNTDQLYTLFEGIEFNKRALWSNKDSIKLGTTNGYIATSKKQLLKRVAENAKPMQKQAFISLKHLLIILISILGALFIPFYILFKKKRHISSIETNGMITLKDIEEFILLNLGKVTINTLKDHFKLSNRSLYRITSPHKPGGLITKIRIDRANELFAKGINLEYIAKQTGFSSSYLKKVIRKK